MCSALTVTMARPDHSTCGGTAEEGGKCGASEGSSCCQQSGGSALVEVAGAAASSQQGSDRQSASDGPVSLSHVPQDISSNEELRARIEADLPSNYEFEIPKCLGRIRELNAKSVALQFPEGLLMFATTIADILEEYVRGKLASVYYRELPPPRCDLLVY